MASLADDAGRGVWNVFKWGRRATTAGKSAKVADAAADVAKLEKALEVAKIQKLQEAADAAKLGVGVTGATGRGRGALQTAAIGAGGIGAAYVGTQTGAVDHVTGVVGDGIGQAGTNILGGVSEGIVNPLVGMAGSFILPLLLPMVVIFALFKVL